MEAFEQPHCPASYPTPSTFHSNVTHESMHNDALVYLAVAVATFAAVPSFLWLRDRRRKSRERRRNRVVVESIKLAKDAARALEAVPPPGPVADPTVADEHQERDVEDAKERKKRTKDRRKRGREPSRSVRSKKPLTSSRALPAPHESPPNEYTPRASEQSRFSPQSMPDIASPMPMSLLSSSFHSPSPSPSQSESSSQPSCSVSASSTTAPLTPPSLPPTHSLPPPVIKTDEANTWAPHLPRNDPAWDWDGQSSTYSSGSRAPSSSSHAKPIRREELSNSSSPISPLVPSAPSLVFPSLNAHPPPGASLSTQIASLKGALEASRTREEVHRRDAERWSKDYDLIKWRWNEASDMWRRREAELQTQMHHLVHQLQTLTHTIQAASLSPTVAPLPFVSGQPTFPLAMPFPSHHHPSSPFLGGGIHQFDLRSPSAASLTNGSDTVNEGLAEAILKRPGSIRPSTTSSSRSRSGMHRGGGSHEERRCTNETPEKGEAELKEEQLETEEEIIEFEFPTLLERRVVSPRVEPTASIDGVEIFN